MKFDEFAQLLHPIIGGASSTHVFVKTLFDAIVTEEGQSVLDETQEETYKAYYNGNTGITRIAKKINPFVEPEEFVEYCSQFSDATAISLCDSFRPHLPEINPHNAGELLADLFTKIIKEAASFRRKSTTKSARQAEKERKEKIRRAMENTGGVVVENFTSQVEKLLDETRDNKTPETEVVDDEMPSGAASEDKKITVIHQQTNVVQNGENNFNLTNNGTMNFDLKGGGV